MQHEIHCTKQTETMNT